MATGNNQSVKWKQRNDLWFGFCACTEAPEAHFDSRLLTYDLRPMTYEAVMAETGAVQELLGIVETLWKPKSQSNNHKILNIQKEHAGENHHGKY